MDFWTGRRKLKIPKLGFGTWQIRGRECTKAVHTALEVGYRHIDTAQIYDNESEVGEAIESSQIDRKEIFLTTKVWRNSLDFRELLISTSHSLEKLRTNYVDLLLIHWPNSLTPLKDSVAALRELIKTKKVKLIGVSNFNVQLMKEAFKLSRALICNQVEYHPFLPQKKVLKEIRKNKMFLTAYSPLARGEVFKNPTLKLIGQKYGKTPGQVALRWLIEQKDVVAIPKSQSTSHIKKNFNIFDFKLDKKDIKEMTRLQSKNKRLVNPEWSPKWD